MYSKNNGSFNYHKERLNKVGLCQRLSIHRYSPRVSAYGFVSALVLHVRHVRERSQISKCSLKVNIQYLCIAIRWPLYIDSQSPQNLQFNKRPHRMRISLESSVWCLIKTAALAIFIVQMINALQKYLANPMVSSVTYKNLREAAKKVLF